MLAAEAVGGKNIKVNTYTSQCIDYETNSNFGATETLLPCTIITYTDAPLR
jgi:hypothetical protein